MSKRNNGCPMGWAAILILLIWTGCTSTPGTPASASEEAADSIAIVTTLIEADSANGQWYATRARLYLGHGNLDPALRDLNQALLLDPQNMRLYLMLSDVYLVLGQSDRSRKALEKASSLDPSSTVPYLKLSEVLFMEGKAKAAVTAADRALSIDNHNAEAFYLKGVALLQTGDTANARLNLQLSVNNDTVNFMGLMQLASIALAQRDTMVTSYLQSALRLQPNDERALFFLGMVDQEHGRMKEALSYFNRVTDLYPENKRAWYHSGYLNLVELGDYRQAKQDFAQAVALDSAYVEAVYNLGRSCEALGEYDEARSHYRGALELLPNYPLAVQGLNRLDDQGL